MKLVAIIDPIDSLNIKKDSTVAMLKAASKLGLELFYTVQAQLYVDNGKPMAMAQALTLTLENECWYELKSAELMDMSEVDIVLMRKDPPFNINYIYTTYFLDLVEKNKAVICNPPQSLRDANEKYFLTHFEKVMPPTLISQSSTQLKQFWQTHGDVIFKPLDGMGGKGIFHVDKSGQNINVVIETLTKNGQEPIMAQRYIAEIKTTGDKRILIIGDEIIPYALTRIPQGDDERGNLAKGAKGAVVPLTDHDYRICDALMPNIKARDLNFVGIDVIGHYLTEINITSPTGIVEIEANTDILVAEKLIQTLINKAKSKQ